MNYRHFPSNKINRDNKMEDKEGTKKSMRKKKTKIINNNKEVKE